MIHSGGGWQSGEDGKSVLLVHMYVQYSVLHHKVFHMHMYTVVVYFCCPGEVVFVRMYVILLHIPFPSSLVRMLFPFDATGW